MSVHDCLRRRCWRREPAGRTSSASSALLRAWTDEAEAVPGWPCWPGRAPSSQAAKVQPAMMMMGDEHLGMRAHHPPAWQSGLSCRALICVFYVF